jgi:hypothetical protein
MNRCDNDAAAVRQRRGSGILCIQHNNAVYFNRFSSEYLQATPQFRPFNGEIPPPVPSLIRDHKNIPQLRLYSNAESKIDSTEETADLVKSVVRRWADHEPGHDADDHHHPEPEPEPSAEPEPEPSHDHDNHSKSNKSSSMFCNTFFVVIIAGVILFRF